MSTPVILVRTAAGSRTYPSPGPAGEAPALEGWLRQVAVPPWFEPVSQESRILKIAPTRFESITAVVALLEIPQGRSPMDMKQRARLDERRLARRYEDPEGNPV